MKLPNFSQPIQRSTDTQSLALKIQPSGIVSCLACNVLSGIAKSICLAGCSLLPI